MIHHVPRLLAAMLLAAAQLATAQTAGPAPAAPPDMTPQQLREAVMQQLPPAPAGFGWHLYRNAAFLRPDGWQGREGVAPPGGVQHGFYAISPEAFSEVKQFEMGLTLNVFSGLRARGLDARQSALLYLKPFVDSHKKEDILILDQRMAGDFERTVLRYRDAPPGLKPIIVHKFLLANNATDSVHVFTFESPQATWADHWARYGTPILSKVMVMPLLPPY